MSRVKSNTLDVLGVRVSITNPRLAREDIERWIQNRYRTYVCVAPVSTVVDCQTNPEYKNIINQAGMTTPDGMPIVWLGRMRGIKQIERTYGPDLMLDICGAGQDKEFKHYFYGGSTESIKKLIEQLKQKFPRIKIVGHYAPPMRGNDVREEPSVIEGINKADPDIVWVGLGSPKQDHWMVNHRAALHAPVMIGVGAAFDFIAGIKPQAPVWMRKMGLEWFFRLCAEPRRLWRRYLIGNSKFLFWIIRDWFRGSLGRGK